MDGRGCNAGWWPAAVAPALVVMAAAGAAAGPTREEPALARTFGSGAHAYFSGDFARAYDLLTEMIEAGSDDPRARYFRGLAALRLGRLDAAEADFSQAAQREADAIGDWGVSTALERVQGCDRLRLERHRVRARVASVQRSRVKGGTTTGSMWNSNEGDVVEGELRDRVPAPPEPGLRVPVPAGRPNPFGEPADDEALPGGRAEGPAPEAIPEPADEAAEPTSPDEPEPAAESMPVDVPAAPDDEPAAPADAAPVDEPAAPVDPVPADGGLEPEMEAPQAAEGDGAAEPTDDVVPAAEPGEGTAEPGAGEGGAPATEDPFGDNPPPGGVPADEPAAEPAAGQ